MLQLGIASLKRSKAWVLTGFFCGGSAQTPSRQWPSATSSCTKSPRLVRPLRRAVPQDLGSIQGRATSAKTKCSRLIRSFPEPRGSANRGGRRRLPCSRPGAARPGGRPPWSSACRRCGRLPYLTFFQRSSLAPERPAQSPHCVDNSAHVINRCSCLSAGSTSSTCACRARRPASLATHVLTSWQAFLGLGQVTWPGALAQPESSSVL